MPPKPPPPKPDHSTYIPVVQQPVYVPKQVHEDCPHCHGLGRLRGKTCDECCGTGKVWVEKK